MDPLAKVRTRLEQLNLRDLCKDEMQIAMNIEIWRSSTGVIIDRETSKLLIDAYDYSERNEHQEAAYDYYQKEYDD